jgi:hypothetical protein
MCVSCRMQTCLYYFMYYFSDVMHNNLDVSHKPKIRVMKARISRLFVCLELENFVFAHHLELSLR